MVKKIHQISTRAIRSMIVERLRKAGAHGETRSDMLSGMNKELRSGNESISQHFGQALDFIDPTIPVDYIDGVFYHRDFSPANINTLSTDTLLSLLEERELEE